MKSMKNAKVREKVIIGKDDLMDMWNGLYFKDSTYDFNGENYKHIMVVNTSDKSDGPSWDYIIKRESDDKFFKFNVWEASNGYIFVNEFLIEVFEEKTVCYK